MKRPIISNLIKNINKILKIIFKIDPNNKQMQKDYNALQGLREQHENLKRIAKGGVNQYIDANFPTAPQGEAELNKLFNKSFEYRKQLAIKMSRQGTKNAPKLTPEEQADVKVILKARQYYDSANFAKKQPRASMGKTFKTPEKPQGPRLLTGGEPTVTPQAEPEAKVPTTESAPAAPTVQNVPATTTPTAPKIVKQAIKGGQLDMQTGAALLNTITPEEADALEMAETDQERADIIDKMVTIRGQEEQVQQVQDEILPPDTELDEADWAEIEQLKAEGYPEVEAVAIVSEAKVRQEELKAEQKQKAEVLKIEKQIKGVSDQIEANTQAMSETDDPEQIDQLATENVELEAQAEELDAQLAEIQAPVEEELPMPQREGISVDQLDGGAGEEVVPTDEEIPVEEETVDIDIEDAVEATPEQVAVVEETAPIQDNEYTDLKGNPVPINNDGTITVYHRTDSNPEDIKSKGFKSMENTEEVFVSTKPDGQIKDYGKNVVELKVPKDQLRIDDAFDDEVHFAVKSNVADKSIIKTPTEPISKTEEKPTEKPKEVIDTKKKGKAKTPAKAKQSSANIKVANQEIQDAFGALFEIQGTSKNNDIRGGLDFMLGALDDAIDNKDVNTIGQLLTDMDNLVFRAKQSNDGDAVGLENAYYQIDNGIGILEKEGVLPKLTQDKNTTKGKAKTPAKEKTIPMDKDIGTTIRSQIKPVDTQQKTEAQGITDAESDFEMDRTDARTNFITKPGTKGNAYQQAYNKRFDELEAESKKKGTAKTPAKAKIPKKLKENLSIYPKQVHDGIIQIYDDIVDIYPYKMWSRFSGDDSVWQVIGASKSKDGQFYYTKGGVIDIFHSMSMFPSEAPKSGKGTTQAKAKIEPKNESLKFTATTPQQGKKVSGEWEIIDANDLITSKDDGYNQKYQPRDRNTQASKEQIEQIANSPDFDLLEQSATTDTGSPLIDTNKQVISGNGRTLGLRKAYQTKKAKVYKGKVLAKAKELGIDVTGIKNPILVRKITDTGEASIEEIAELSNRPQVLSRTEAEQARADSKLLLANDAALLEIFAPDADGNIVVAQNNDFVNKFIQATGEQSLRDSDGNATPKVDERVKRAVLGAILQKHPTGDSILKKLIEQDQKLGLQRQVKGLSINAGKLLKLAKTKPEFNLLSALAQSLDDFVDFRTSVDKGDYKATTQGIENFLNQDDFFEQKNRTPESLILFKALAQAKSIKEIKEFFDEYIQRAENLDTTTEDMFGYEIPSKAELLRRANNEDTQEADLFTEDSKPMQKQETTDADGSIAKNEKTITKNGKVSTNPMAAEALADQKNEKIKELTNKLLPSYQFKFNNVDPAEVESIIMEKIGTSFDKLQKDGKPMGQLEPLSRTSITNALKNAATTPKKKPDVVGVEDLTAVDPTTPADEMANQEAVKNMTKLVDEVGSPQQKEIFKGMLEGKSLQEIADELGSSLNSVTNQRNKLWDKLEDDVKEMFASEDIQDNIQRLFDRDLPAVMQEIAAEVRAHVKEYKTAKNIRFVIEPQSPKEAGTMTRASYELVTENGRKVPTVTLYADAITRGDVEGLLRHEAFVHAFLKSIVGQKEYSRLIEMAPELVGQTNAARISDHYSKKYKNRPDMQVKVKEEMLADWADRSGFENADKPGFFRDLLDKIVRWIKKHLGISYTRKEVVNAMSDAFRKYKKGSQLVKPPKKYFNQKTYPGSKPNTTLAPVGTIMYDYAEVELAKLEGTRTYVPVTQGAEVPKDFDGVKKWMTYEAKLVSDLVDPKSPIHAPIEDMSLVEYIRNYFDPKGVEELRNTFKGDTAPAWVQDKKMWQDVKDELTELEKIRDGEEPKVSLGEKYVATNIKTGGYSLDYILGTCMPTARCAVCYAKGNATNLANTCKARLRHSITSALYPKEVGLAVSKFVKAKSKGIMPFFRINGAGDTTFQWQADVINTLVDNVDRPLHIFSRSHVSRAKGTIGLDSIKNGKYDPNDIANGVAVYKMGSIDKQLVDEYGIDFLKDNLTKRGIVNSYLVGDPEDAAIVKDLLDKGVPVILHVDSKKDIVDALMKERVLDVAPACPCSTDSGPKINACSTCLVTEGTCFMVGSQIAMSPDGQLVPYSDISLGNYDQKIETLVPMSAIGRPQGSFKLMQEREVVAHAYKLAAQKLRSGITSALRKGTNLRIENPRDKIEIAYFKKGEVKKARPIAKNWDDIATTLMKGGPEANNLLNKDKAQVDVLASRERAKENFKMPIPIADTGLNVRVDGKNDYPDMIVSGKKTIETRDTRSIDKIIGKPVSIIKTQDGEKAKVIGEAVFGEPKFYATKEEFDADYKKHRVPTGSKYDFPEGGKWGYPITNAKRYSREIKAPENKGIKWTNNLRDKMFADEVGGLQEYDDFKNELKTIKSFNDVETKKTLGTGKPVKVFYLHNTEKSPDMGSRFGQDIEPSGKYVTLISDKRQNETLLPNMERGLANIKNPLVLEWTGYEEDGWKQRLSNQYNGKTGMELTKALVNDGYDAVITVSEHKSGEKWASETVLLPKTVAKDYTSEIDNAVEPFEELTPEKARRDVQRITRQIKIEDEQKKIAKAEKQLAYFDENPLKFSAMKGRKVRNSRGQMEDLSEVALRRRQEARDKRHTAIAKANEEIERLRREIDDIPQRIVIEPEVLPEEIDNMNDDDLKIQGELFSLEMPKGASTPAKTKATKEKLKKAVKESKNSPYKLDHSANLATLSKTQKHREENLEQILNDMESQEAAKRSLRARLNFDAIPQDQQLDRVRAELAIVNFTMQNEDIIRKLIVDYARKIGLDKEVRNRIPTLMKNTKTVKKFRDALQIMDETFEKRLKAKLLKKAKDIIKTESKRIADAKKGRKKLSGKADINNALDEYLNSLESIGPKKQTELEDLKNSIEDLDNKTDVEVTDEIKQQLERLSKPNIDAMNSKQIQEVIDNIKAFKENRKKSHQFHKMVKAIALEKEVEKGLKEIKESKAGVITNIPGFLANARPERILRMFGSWNPRSAVSKNTFDKINAAENAELAGTERSTKFIEQIMEPIRKLPKKIRTQKFQLKTAPDAPETTLRPVKELSNGWQEKMLTVQEAIDRGFTLDEMMFIYANSQNPDNVSHLLGTGFSEANLEEVEALLPPEAKNAVDQVIDFYDNEMYPRLSKAFEEEYGITMPKVPRYFPIMRLNNDASVQSELFREVLARHSVASGMNKDMLKGRKIGADSGFRDFDFSKTLMSNIKNSEHYIAFSKPLAEVRKFLNDPEIKDAMMKKNHTAYMKVKSWLEDAAVGKLRKGVNNSAIDKWSDIIRRNVTPAYLGFKIVTQLKQIPSFATGLSRLDNPMWSIPAIADYIANPKTVHNFVKDKSVMMRNRHNQWMREFAEEYEKMFTKKFTQGVGYYKKAQDVSMQLIQMTDQIVTTALWMAKYKEIMNQNGNEKMAIEEADRLIRDTQPMGGLIHLPELYRAGGVLKSFTMFTNQLNQYANLNWETGAGAKKRGKKGIAWDVLFNNILPSALIYMIATGFSKMPWEDVEGWAEAYMHQATGGIFGYNVLSDVVTSEVANYSRESKGLERRRSFASFDSTTMGAINNVISKLQDRKRLKKDFERIENGTFNMKEVKKSALFKLTQEVMSVTGVPGTGAGATAVKGIEKFKETGDIRYLLWSEYTLNPVKVDEDAAEKLKAEAFKQKLRERLEQYK
jgi:hypothetical protein